MSRQYHFHFRQRADNLNAMFCPMSMNLFSVFNLFDSILHISTYFMYMNFVLKNKLEVDNNLD